MRLERGERRSVHRFVIIAGLFALAILLSSCMRTMPTYNVSERSFPIVVSQKLTLDEVAAAMSIAGAGRADSWIFSRQGQNELAAELHIRQHYAKVRIPFTTERFSILYDESDELLYDGTVIHRNYNKWVRFLEQDIIEEVTAAASRD